MLNWTHDHYCKHGICFLISWIYLKFLIISLVPRYCTPLGTKRQDSSLLEGLSAFLGVLDGERLILPWHRSIFVKWVSFSAGAGFRCLSAGRSFRLGILEISSCILQAAYWISEGPALFLMKTEHPFQRLWRLVSFGKEGD